MSNFTERALRTVVAAGDHLVPKRRSVVLRTGPDFPDQGRQLVPALAAVGVDDVTWLTDGAAPTPAATPVTCRCLSATSLQGIWAFWRASVVVHTHGVYGSVRMSRRKAFVNIWHGMPIKRLQANSDVGRNQTDLTIATSPTHAVHLADTWGLARERVHITGLPRNDVLVGEAPELPPSVARFSDGRPLAVWLPTYRRQAVGGSPATADGVDTGTATQFAGGTPEAVAALADRLGIRVVVKSHPLAPAPESEVHGAYEIWSNHDLADAGLTLYELLAHADLVISDHSSVWVDFLLTQRPLVFAISDLDEYRQSRGFYFSDVEGLLPGPIATDLEGLEAALQAVLSDDGPWAARRRAALALHHDHPDGGSADRVASLVAAALSGELSC